MKLRNKAFLHKVEAVKGADAVPTVGNDLVILNGDINIGIPTEKDDGADDLKGTFGPGASVTTKQSMTVPAASRVRGLGQGVGALLVPDIHAALMASGHAVVSSGDGIATPRAAVYTPTSDSALLRSATGYFYEDGLLYSLLGAVNDLTFEASMSALKASFNVQAGYAVGAVVALPAISQPSTEVFRMTSALCTIDEGGSTVNIGAFTFNAGVDVQEANETGLHYFEVANRTPTISIDPRAVATIADWDALTNSTQMAITATFTNSLGETLVFNGQQAELAENTAGGRAGNITRQKSYALKESAGDDQYSITFTSVL
ncbi:MAG: hypothetical protein COA54_02515 [Thiotrichaceae bacterium]|nr:MAG: hypothetical protein COA54_02515 [Thiotrichaceae bacterium]